MSDAVKIPKSEYAALIREVRRGLEICDQIAELRFTLRAVLASVKNKKALERAIKSCEEVARLRIDLSVLERRLSEVDDDLTPVRPPSRQDIKAAFDASVEFAQGKKKKT